MDAGWVTSAIEIGGYDQAGLCRTGKNLIPKRATRMRGDGRSTLHRCVRSELVAGNLADS
jgi:hypothetical protein